MRTRVMADSADHGGGCPRVAQLAKSQLGVTGRPQDSTMAWIFVVRPPRAGLLTDEQGSAFLYVLVGGSWEQRRAFERGSANLPDRAARAVDRPARSSVCVEIHASALLKHMIYVCVNLPDKIGNRSSLAVLVGRRFSGLE